jgi:hypothetical protein
MVPDWLAAPYHFVCAQIWGRDYTIVASDARHEQWWQFHDFLLAWSFFFNFLTLVAVVCLMVWFIRRRGHRCG